MAISLVAEQVAFGVLQVGDDGCFRARVVTVFECCHNRVVFPLVNQTPLGGDDTIFQFAPFGLLAYRCNDFEQAHHEAVVAGVGHRLMQGGIPQFKLIETSGLAPFQLSKTS